MLEEMPKNKAGELPAMVQVGLEYADRSGVLQPTPAHGMRDFVAVGVLENTDIMIYREAAPTGPLLIS